MDTRHLTLFVDAVRLGSLAATARTHGLDPSSVSRALTNLEDELGVRLMHRTTRKLVLTDAGRRFLDRIQPVVAGLDEAREFAKDASADLSGLVRATVPVSYALRRIVPRLADFRSRYPHIELDLRMSDARLDLLDARLDLAVRLGRLTDPTLTARRLHAMRYVVVASPAYLERRGTPARPEDLETHETLLFPLSVGPRWFFRAPDASETTDIALSARLTLSNTLALRQAAIDGLGITVLADWVVDDALSDGDLVPLFEDHEVAVSAFDAAVWVVFPASRYVPARVRAFAEWLGDSATSR